MEVMAGASFLLGALLILVASPGRSAWRAGTRRRLGHSASGRHRQSPVIGGLSVKRVHHHEKNVTF